MKRYIAVRILQLVPVLLAVTLVSFALMHLAGTDAVMQKYDRAGIVVSSDVIEAERARLGLDQSFLTQYARWLGRMLHGDMGVSFITGQDVFETFTAKLPATLLLAASSLFVSAVVSVPLGVAAAVKRHTVIDYIIRFFSFCGNSMPNFFTALVLLYVFAVYFPFFPVISGDGWQSLVLPALTLSTAMTAKYIRQVRAAVLEEMGKAYVTGAKARGIPFYIVLVRSILRTALITLVTLFALSAGSLLGGAAIVESIFMWDGVGKLAVDAVHARDYPVIQAYVVWMAVIYVSANLLADIAYRYLDPRIRWKKGP